MPKPPRRVALLPQNPDRVHGLGRHIDFDERSRGFAVQLPKAAKIVTRTWDRKVPPFDQGQLGSCTGNGAVGVIATAPHAKPKKVYDEALAKKVYTQATKLDSIVGSWPPSDTGSTILGAMKALKSLKLITSYAWAFSLDSVLKTLSNTGPVEVGVSWYSGFDEPDSEGRVRLGGSIEGGHAFELLGVDAEKKLVWACNSWGTGWGVDGRFCFSWDDLDHLLHESGEAASVWTAP